MKATRIPTLIALCLAVGLSTAACGSSDPEAASDAPDGAKTLVIGDLESLTGAAASVGVGQANAVKLAVKEINKSGGIDVGGTTYAIKLDVQDEKSDPTAAVNAVQGFISDGTKFMVGTVSSSGLGAYLPIIQDNDDFITVVMGAALEGATDHASVYRPRVTISQYTSALSKYIADQGDIKSVATLTDKQHSAFVQQLEPLKDALADDGVKVVASTDYTLGATEFGSQLSAMLRSKPDALNFRGYPADMTRAIKQAREQGFDGAIFTTSGITQTEVDDAQATAAMEGVTDVYAPLPEDLVEGDKNADRAQAFIDAYKAAYKEAPAGTSMSAYDGVYILAKAFEKAGTVDDVAAVRKALDGLTVKDVDQMVELIKPQAGDLIFDQRQAFFEVAVRVWRDGAFHVDGFVG
jgi:branched-chain amino acid transport system substrate-binding protein